MPARSLLYARKQGIREEPIDDAVFLIDEDGKAIHMLERLSCGIWNLLGEPMSVADVGRLVNSAFPGISSRRLVRDVKMLFADLEEAGLIAPVRPGLPAFERLSLESRGAMSDDPSPTRAADRA
jgi:hypothetical protein